MQRIGLTGSIGAGKSTVAALLRERGYTVLDADQVAREVTQSPEVLQELAAEFSGVVAAGQLDRAALAAVVFGDAHKLARLNAITHPRIRARMAQLEQQARNGGARVVIQDIPLLFETGQAEQFDAVWVVDAPLEQRIARVMARSGLDRAEVLARDARQLPAEQKRRKASVVLDNSGTEAQLAAQLDKALAELEMEKGVR